jgi:transcriptional regulator with XRE-family HTH domain
MTQRQLAEAAETSQQQIQRIESGVQTARIDMALRISAALEAPMEKVFPAARKVLGKSVSKRNSIRDLLKDERAIQELSDAGIDASGQIHTIKFMLRSGFMGFHEISSNGHDRLWEAVQQSDRFHNFVVYDTPDERVAINLNHLVFAQFLFDPVSMMRDSSNDTTESLRVYTSVRREPLEFGVEPDTADMADVDEGSADEEAAQLQSLMYFIEMSHEDNDIFTFADVDGERAFLRASDVSMITVPLAYIEPKLFESEMERFGEMNSDEGDDSRDETGPPA